MLYRQMIAILAATAITPANAHVTAVEAQTLPLPELAARTLGDAGSIMVDVDRPQWSGPFALPGAPPLSYLAFYQRPAPAYPVEGWTGLCSSLVVTLHYREKEVLDFLDTKYVYGIAGNMTRSGTPPEQVQARCGALSPKTDFFYAPTSTEAATIAIVLERLRQTGSDRKRWSFNFTCSRQFRRDCGPPSSLAEDYATRGGWGLDPSPCKLPPPVTSVPDRDESCVALYRQNGCSSVSTLTIGFDRKNDDVALKSVAYQETMIVC